MRSFRWETNLVALQNSSRRTFDSSSRKFVDVISSEVRNRRSHLINFRRNWGRASKVVDSMTRVWILQRCRCLRRSIITAKKRGGNDVFFFWIASPSYGNIYCNLAWFYFRPFSFCSLGMRKTAFFRWLSQGIGNANRHEIAGKCFLICSLELSPLASNTEIQM